VATDKDSTSTHESLGFHLAKIMTACGLLGTKPRKICGWIKKVLKTMS